MNNNILINSNHQGSSSSSTDNSSIIGFFLSILHRFFDNKLLHDDRIPFYTTRVMIKNNSNMNDNNNENNNTIYEMKLLLADTDLHIQATILILLQIIVAIFLSIIIYHFIIVPQKQQQQRKQLQQQQQQQQQQQNSRNKNRLLPSSSSSYIIGFGIIIPIALYYPFVLINYFDIRNRAIRYSTIILPAVITLRMFVILFSNDNDSIYYHRIYNTMTRKEFIQYMGFMSLPKYTTTTIAPNNSSTTNSTSTSSSIITTNSSTSKKDVEKISTTTTTTTTTTIVQGFSCRWYLRIVYEFIFWSTITGIAFSILLPYNFQPFPTTSSSPLLSSSNNNGSTILLTVSAASDYYPTFELSRIYNNFIVANVLYLIFQASDLVISLLMNLFSGCQYEYNLFHGHPLYNSTSPSDFWSKRWNILIHQDLKEGIYKPILTYYKNKHKKITSYHKIIAKIATFAISGLLHEYIIALVCYTNIHEIAEGNNCMTCYKPNYGKHSMFFIWNGILLIVEDVVGKYCTTLSLPKYIPKLLLNHLAVLTALTVSHLYTDDMLLDGYYDGMKRSIPLIIIEKISSTS